MRRISHEKKNIFHGYIKPFSSPEKKKKKKRQSYIQKCMTFPSKSISLFARKWRRLKKKR